MSWRASSLEKMVMLGKIEGRRRGGDRAIDGIIDSVDMNEWVKVAQSFPTLTPWTIQSMEFSRSEYWSGWPFPSPGDLSNPGMKPRFPALQVDSLPAEPQGKPSGHEFEQTPGDGVGQASLVTCSPWSHSESDMTEWLNNNKNSICQVYLNFRF